MFPSHMLFAIRMEHNESAEQPKSIAPAIAKMPTCLFLLSAILPCFSPLSFLTWVSKCSLFHFFFILLVFASTVSFLCFSLLVLQIHLCRQAVQVLYTIHPVFECANAIDVCPTCPICLIYTANLQMDRSCWKMLREAFGVRNENKASWVQFIQGSNKIKKEVLWVKQKRNSKTIIINHGSRVA